MEEPAAGARESAVPAPPAGALETVFRELFWPYGAFRRVRSPLQRALRWTKRAVVLLLVAYVVLCFFPRPLFPHSLRHGNLVLHAQKDLGADALAVLEEAHAKVERSAFYRRDETHDVYLCDGWVPYRAFVPLGGREVFASANALTRNVFVANPDVGARRALPNRSRGSESRSLAAVVAHEVTHDLLRSEYGYFGSLSLPSWKAEGYCEYVAGGSSFDFERGVAMLKAGESEAKMPFRYLHWRILATYALDVLRLDAAAFFRDDVGLDDLDAKMLAALRDGSFVPRDLP